MFIDMMGKKRMKINLHTHTTLSDGHKTPEEAARIYKEEGYDALAITDHWQWTPSGEIEGLRIISGCEHNIGENNTKTGVYHILSIGCTSAPSVNNENSAQYIIDKINEAEGIAVLAHPAWSLNTVSDFMKLKNLAATEIYNTVSGLYANNRPYSGGIIDLAANEDCILPIVATDDTHNYKGEECVSAIMVDVTDGKTSDADLMQKISNGEFYASQGPEIHIKKGENGKVIVDCTPVCLISFYSQSAWNATRNSRGEGLTHAEYSPQKYEKWIRAEVIDADGKTAWSNIIKL